MRYGRPPLPSPRRRPRPLFYPLSSLLLLLLHHHPRLQAVPGIIAPIVAGDLVAAPHDDAQHWIYVFVIAGAVAVTGVVVFISLADDKLAPSLLPPPKRAGETEQEEAGLLTAAEREEARSC